jgi:hypothetical protein
MSGLPPNKQPTLGCMQIAYFHCARGSFVPMPKANVKLPDPDAGWEEGFDVHPPPKPATAMPLPHSNPFWNVFT